MHGELLKITCLTRSMFREFCVRSLRSCFGYTFHQSRCRKSAIASVLEIPQIQRRQLGKSQWKTRTKVWITQKLQYFLRSLKSRSVLVETLWNILSFGSDHQSSLPALLIQWDFVTRICLLPLLVVKEAYSEKDAYRTRPEGHLSASRRDLWKRCRAGCINIHIETLAAAVF